ncbi:ArsR/SmtB family transcription factor [Alteribacter lacisalsi]|uniref:ArsR/SmtB family transcription factor n=1 Tax=Alteribacter lacisalsi TaxID=2045244 RepID=UPI001F0007EE|nr:metalloregulator ArsR/SmtB family transcription factor [Alteribacter lacisalsi]
MDSKKEPFEEAALLFKLIGDKTRLKMLAILYRDECCVCELVDIFQMSQPSVSQHLKKLKLAGVVSERRSGQWIYYRINDEYPAYSQLVSIIEKLPDMQPVLAELMASGKRVCCD